MHTPLIAPSNQTDHARPGASSSTIWTIRACWSSLFDVHRSSTIHSEYDIEVSGRVCVGCWKEVIDIGK